MLGCAFWTPGQLPSAVGPTRILAEGSLGCYWSAEELRDWGGGQCWPVQRVDLVALHASAPRHTCSGLPGVLLGGQGSEGPAGNSGPDDKEAGSPREEPHLSLYKVRSKRLLSKFGVSSLFG